MASFYDLSIDKKTEFKRILADAGLSTEMVEKVIKYPYLGKRMVDAIDVYPSQESPKSSIPWTPVADYAYHIMARSQLRGWGFTPDDAYKLSAKLHDHDGPLTPTGVSIWLGKNLGYNWTEMTTWIEDEVKKLGFTFHTYFDTNRLSFLAGSEHAGKRKLDVVDLDIATFWDPTNGVIPGNVRSTRSKWPGLEVATLLALNPQVYVAMDGKTIPYMFAPGLVVDSDYLPRFYRSARKVYADGGWAVYRWYCTSVVAFRE